MMTVLCLPADMGTAFAKHFLQQLRDQATDIVLDGGAVKRLGGGVSKFYSQLKKQLMGAKPVFLFKIRPLNFRKLSNCWEAPSYLRRKIINEYNDC